MNEPEPVKADLIPYTPEYLQEVRSWIDSRETYYNLSRSKDFPPPADVIRLWQREDVSSYLLYTGNHPVAYGELWHRPQEMAIEIAHILVKPILRWQGYGTTMVRLLFERASTKPEIAKVVINLPVDNPEYLSCCTNAGFELVGTPAGVSGLRMIRVVTRSLL